MPCRAPGDTVLGDPASTRHVPSSAPHSVLQAHPPIPRFLPCTAGSSGCFPVFLPGCISGKLCSRVCCGHLQHCMSQHRGLRGAGSAGMSYGWSRRQCWAEIDAAAWMCLLMCQGCLWCLRDRVTLPGACSSHKDQVGVGHKGASWTSCSNMAPSFRAESSLSSLYHFVGNVSGNV